MQFSFRSTIRSVSVLALLSCTGCFTAARQAFSEVRGAQATVEPISASGSFPAANIAQVRFRPPRTEAPGGSGTPGTLVTAFESAARKAEADFNRGSASGGRTVEVDTKLIYFRERGLLGSSLLLARVQAHEAGRTLLDAFVHTETQSIRDGDVEGMTRAVVEGVAKYLTGRERELLDLDGERDARD